MVVTPHTYDVELSASDIRELENADRVAHLFARLGYRVDDRTKITNLALLGLDSADLRQHIRSAELLAKDSSGEIVVYLFEVRSITAKLRNDIARAFRERPEHALLVLTKDYTTLEFVFLDVQTKERRGIQASQGLVLRPIPLSVRRLEPDLISVRILRRFTFTEADEGYQWEKLRSAYVLAQWTEEYFNNRALFSDYYLKNRLPELPEWNADLSVALKNAHDLLVGARAKFSGKPESEVREALFEPLFSLLGFEAEVGKEGSSDGDEPDYRLYIPGDRSKPVAAALTYVWNRNLDDQDETRDFETQDEIPGAQVVSLLEKQVAPWVIVTNGKLWRLYSATASNKATNYYEIDLEESLAATEQVTALKYWWLLFRAGAFTGFLDRLLSGSAQYAKELGDRLKERVFVEIFPQFARGFIAHMRAQGMTVTEADLPPVFSATMTFLYRLMFILYAESLDLLPVVEPNGYAEASLQRLKQEIAEAGKANEDNAPGLLRKHYGAATTALYDRLKALFTMIDQGAEAQNLPAYNGGLFSATSDEGRFLAQFAIPDQYLALGLDRLTRDEDDKTKELVFIDFKSLGVRHLGSIYEGLLEFKLRIAAEPLAVERDGKREIYVPLKQAKKKNAEAAVNKGDVYLENDKKERKATGSYYTPDYIVKYIVQHTVGPVLDRKFEELRPRLHDAQKRYRQHAALVKARGNDQPVELFWQEPPMRQLVDDCLNVRVLDPAMGSGHFLVEVVDYVCNRLIDFLNGWSENPVWAALEETRRDILDDMDKQKVTIDASRLTRVALLKRAVLKRCIYGVDLNLMAVELAKVSLWLDAFTLGAPLSFLDHHLKWGNSLIGARVKEVQDYLGDTRDYEGRTQFSLFDTSEFAGVMLATDLMRQVSYLSDNTVAQVKSSQDAYRGANDHLAPYKRLLDVYTSRWFTNSKIETGGAKAAKKAKSDYVRLFLKDKHTHDWLKHPDGPLSDALLPATTIAANALRAAEAKRFFHWELEFPEVFFAASTPGGQDVQLREDGGFDAVVGNPPYVQLSMNEEVRSELQDFLLTRYESSMGRLNTFGFFIRVAIELLGHRRYTSMIIPNTFLGMSYYEDLRKWILENASVHSLLVFDSLQFEEAVVETVVYVCQKARVVDNASYVGTEVLRLVSGNQAITTHRVHQSEFSELYQSAFNPYLDEHALQLRRKVSSYCDIVSDHFETNQAVALKKDRGAYVGSQRLSPDWHAVIDGRHIERYLITPDGTYLHYVRDAIHSGDIEHIFNLPDKLYLRRVGDSIVVAHDASRLYALNTLVAITPSHDQGMRACLKTHCTSLRSSKRDIAV